MCHLVEGAVSNDLLVALDENVRLVLRQESVCQLGAKLFPLHGKHKDSILRALLTSQNATLRIPLPQRDFCILHCSSGMPCGSDWPILEVLVVQQLRLGTQKFECYEFGMTWRLRLLHT